VSVDRNRVGQISEQAFGLKLISLGYDICKPLNPQSPYDWVSDIDGKLARIQVKTGRIPKNNDNAIEFSCCAKTAKPYSETCDYFGVYCPELLSYYLIPVAIITTLGTARLIVNPFLNCYSDPIIAKIYQI